jgi:hypothetical protein
MRPIFQSKITNLNVSGIEYQLSRIATALEALIEKPQIQPNIDFDPDDYSEVSYTNEEEELVAQHLSHRIAGIAVK